MNQQKFRRFDLEKASNPPSVDGTYELFINRHWSVDEDGMGLFYHETPQCSTYPGIAEKFVSFENHPAKSVKFCPSIWVQIGNNDEFILP